MYSQNILRTREPAWMVNRMRVSVLIVKKKSLVFPRMQSQTLTKPSTNVVTRLIKDGCDSVERPEKWLLKRKFHSWRRWRLDLIAQAIALRFLYTKTITTVTKICMWNPTPGGTRFNTKIGARDRLCTHGQNTVQVIGSQTVVRKHLDFSTRLIIASAAHGRRAKTVGDLTDDTKKMGKMHASQSNLYVRTTN